MDEIQEPVGAAIHSITSGGSCGVGRENMGRERHETLSGVFHTPKARCARGQALPIFLLAGAKV
jgi:hypothetical protein